MNGMKRCVLVFLVVAVPTTVLSVGQTTYPVKTEIKDGVKTITNPDFPRDGRFIAKLTEELSCGEENGGEAGLLNKPLRLDVDDQGNIYVMDYGDVNIKVYDAKGHYLRAVGRQGQGPGEFGGVVFFRVMTGGRLCVLDFVQHRVIIMTSEGQYVSGFPLEGFFGTIAVDGRDRLFLGKRGAVKEPDKLSTELQEVPYVTSIFRTEASGEGIAHLADLLGESMFMKSAGAGIVGGMRGPHGIVWNVSRDGKVYGGYNADYSIWVFGENGKKEFAFGREYTPVKTPGYRGAVGQKKTMPAYRNIIFDDAGNIWVELFQAPEAKGVLYDVFSPDGVYSKQVSIDQRIGTIKNGMIYAILQPEEGYASIKGYKMELVPAAK
jgi:hypothetical protein